VITAATYSLYQGTTISDSGTCTVDGAEVKALIQPNAIGDYTLEVTYTVAPETRKVRVAIHVT